MPITHAQLILFLTLIFITKENSSYIHSYFAYKYNTLLWLQCVCV